MFLILIICISISLTWLAHSRPKATVFFIIFLSPWQGLEAEIGLQIQAHQVFLLALIFTLLIRTSVSGKISVRIPVDQVFIFFVIFAVIWSIGQIQFLPERHVAGGSLRSPAFRAFFQIPKFLLDITPVFVIPFILRSRHDLVTAAKIYIYSAVVLAVLGWIQIIIWSSTGWNPMPIGLVKSLLSGEISQRGGMFNFFGYTIYRMNSFGGEPKGLGQSLAFAVILIQLFYMIDSKLLSNRLMKTWIFLFVSVIATMSTSAFYLWFLGTMAMIIFIPFSSSRLNSRRSVSSLMIVFLLLLIVFPILIYDVDNSDDFSISGLLYQRTLGRETVIEDFDDTILKYLKDHLHQGILGVGLGNIHLYADQYIDKRLLFYMAGTAFVAKSGYLRIISELGILGLCLFIYGVWSQANYLDKMKHYSSYDSNFFNMISILSRVSLILFLARGGYVAPQFYLTLGVCVAAKAILIDAEKTDQKESSPYFTGISSVNIQV